MTSQGKRDNGKDRERFDESARENIDVSREMSRLLENRRWEIQEGPFDGFHSPPGRF